MSAMQVTVIDYGIGNLYSVRRALEYCGAEVTLSADPAQIGAAAHLVLPGVGAFGDGMLGLKERGLVEPILSHAKSGRPLLGICLGMQMLSTVSDEFGEHEGLGLIPGRVVALSPVDADGRPHKIPYIGWSALTAPASVDWRGTLLEDSPQGTAVYLIHSFHAVPDEASHVLAQCSYGGHSIVAAVRSGNVSGCQFHPEKSGPAGLQMLSAFLRSRVA